MKVSVIMPCFNKGNTLIQAVESILDQMYEDLELIIIDDASQDNTWELVKQIIDKRVVITRHDVNEGVAQSYLDGIKIATGDIVVFHDPDDISYPDRIKRIVENFDCDVLYHSIYTISAHPNIPANVMIYKEAQEWEKDRIYKEQYIPGICAIKTKFAKKLEIPEKANGCWDWMLHIKLHEMGCKYKALPIGLYEYRRLENSLSLNNEISGKRHSSLAFIHGYLKRTGRVGKTFKFGRGFSISNKKIS